MSDDRVDVWAEIEELIAREAEKKFAAEMLDVVRARDYARGFAESAVKIICSHLGGQRPYVPRTAAHHRQERNKQIRMNFNGDCAAAAKTAGLSVRWIRELIKK